MEIPVGDAIKNIPFIVLGIWPINLLTLLAQGHIWSWQASPQALMGMWEWGAFVSLSLVIIIELGVDMFIALGKYRRRMERAREEGRQEARKETSDILMALNAAARTNPDLLPSLLEEYRAKFQNGASAHE